MAVKLHRCPGQWVKIKAHPCWKIEKALQDMGWQVSTSEFGYMPKDPMEIAESAKKEVHDFLNDLDDNDDVHRIYTALR